MHFNQCLQSRQNEKRPKKVKDPGPVETEGLIWMFFHQDHTNQPQNASLDPVQESELHFNP